jgi:2-desacetyl-2-hydroxyethyl bacteriochlorophyllide A dehydrogenase
MKTTTLWYVGKERVELREVQLPEPARNEALVEVEACGVCAWDLFIYGGGFQVTKPYPFYFGHEGIGRVVETGADVRGLREGQRVALRESPEIGRVGTGHMAGHAVLPEHMLIPLPESRLPAEGWLVEPVACCVNAVDRASVRSGEHVAIVGCGFMGAILLQGLLRTPAASLHAFDVDAANLARARALGGKSGLVAHDVRSLPASSAELDGSFDVVVETAAAESGFHLANRLVKKGGRLVIFSWHHKAFAIDLGYWHINGITVLNVSPAAHPHFDDCFHQSIPLLEGGKIDVRSLVTHVARPEGAQALFAKGLSKSDGYLKGMIRWR